MRVFNHNLMPTKKFLPGIFTSILSLLFAVTLLVTPAYATNVYDLPYVSAGDDTWVVDDADVISRVNQGRLSSNLENLAKETGNELRIVIFRRLDYKQTINSFTEEVFTNWYPTPEDQENQTLLTVDTLSNNAAIRTSEELKSLLTDDIVQSVTDETISYTLKDGSKYNEVLLEASDRLVAVLSGLPDPGANVAEDTIDIDIQATYTTAEDTDDRSATIWVVVLLLLATVIPMATYFWYVGFGN